MIIVMEIGIVAIARRNNEHTHIYLDDTLSQWKEQHTYASHR